MRTKELTKAFNGHEVRVIIQNGVEWFVAKDVCEILDIQDVSSSLRDFPDQETGTHTMQVRSANGIDQNRSFTIINEPGLYRLIFKSRKPEAEAFKTWVFTEVLPSIRKTGKYDIRDIKAKSTENRNAVTAQWQRQGVESPVEYAKLTQEEYQQLYGDSQKRKAEMSRQEILKLSAFEAVESWKLSEIDDGVLKFAGCKESINETAGLLDEVQKIALLQAAL